MSKKTTVTEYFDEDGRLISRETVTEDVYTPYVYDPQQNNWRPTQYPIVSYNTLHG